MNISNFLHLNKYSIVALSFLCITFISGISAQTTYFSRVGHVKVNAYSDLMDMEADNYQIAATFKPEDGSLKFQGLLKSFVFDLGLADRIISDKRINVVEKPKILYEGKVTNMNEIDLETPGEYTIKVKGNLFIWGYKRVTGTTGTLVVHDDGTISSTAKFKMKIEEESVQKVNELMRQHLPAIINVDANKLGLTRDFYIEANMNLNPIIRP